MINKKQLRLLYEKELLSTRQIGKIYGVDKKTICNRLKEYNIPIRNKYTEYKNNCLIKLSGIQKDFIFGTLLGDGHISILKSKRLARFSVSHSIKQIKYIKWKAELLKPLSSNIKINKVYNKQIKKYYTTCNFYTTATKEFLNIHNLFYGPKKIVRLEMLKHIKSPLSIATWFMDDGTINKQDKRADFCTENFNYKDQVKLASKLLEFGIKARVKPYKKSYRLHLTVKETRKLLELVRPHIINSMMYKLC